LSIELRSVVMIRANAGWHRLNVFILPVCDNTRGQHTGLHRKLFRCNVGTSSGVLIVLGWCHRDFRLRFEFIASSRFPLHSPCRPLWLRPAEQVPVPPGRLLNGYTAYHYYACGTEDMIACCWLVAAYGN
jgi:hypothetical protein